MFNDADLAFATAMIPHHAQALVMVDMTQGRDLSPQMQQLTRTSRLPKRPEIELMVDWLNRGGQARPGDHA